MIETYYMPITSPQKLKALQERRDRAIELYEHLKTCRDVALVMGMSHEWVASVIRKHKKSQQYEQKTESV